MEPIGHFQQSSRYLSDYSRFDKGIYTRFIHMGLYIFQDILIFVCF